MICVEIDVAKDKHACFILSSEGEILADVLTLPNNAKAFDTLLQTIRRCIRPPDKIKVGFEATGQYSYNILGFLLNKGRPTPALCHFQRNHVCLPLGANLRSLPCQETSRGQALQCRYLPCCQEACAANLRHGEIQTAIQTGA